MVVAVVVVVGVALVVCVAALGSFLRRFLVVVAVVVVAVEAVVEVEVVEVEVEVDAGGRVVWWAVVALLRRLRSTRVGR